MTLKNFPTLLAVATVCSLLLMHPTGASENNRIAIFDVAISPDGTMVAFSWSGDIWIADINSGDCTRVTDHVAYDNHPAWFPDSKKIAFSSNRDGNDDIYSVSLNGGEPERHTWCGIGDTVMDVAPDGENILFRSDRNLFSKDLYEVDIHGGLEHAVTNDTHRNFEARYSPDGSLVIVCRGIFDWTRRFYNGSGDTDLYVMDRDGNHMRWVERSWDGMDYWPNIYDGWIYFVSDRSGNENVWRMKEGSEPEILTNFSEKSVVFLSVSNNGKVCFTHGFDLYVMDEDGSDLCTITLNLESEPKHSQEIRLDINGQITEMETGPTGEHLAVIARGELYIIPLHNPSDPAPLGDQRYREAVRITETSSREQYVTWHPDGDRLVVSSDIDGNYNLYEIDLRTKEWTQLTDTPEDEIFSKYSPDGSSIAFIRGNRKLVVLNFETGNENVVAEGNLIFMPWISQYEWSPDGNWIAYTAGDKIYYGEVFVTSAATSGFEPVNVTRHHDDDVFGGWAPDGESIYFMSRRNYEVGMEGYGWWWAGGTLHSIPLKSAPPPVSDQLFQDDEADDSDTETDAEDEEINVTIDFERVNERTWQVAHLQGGGRQVKLSPDGKTYIFESNALGNFGLWTISFEGEKPEQVSASGRVDDVEWLPDGSGALYLAGKRVYYWDKESGDVMPVPTSGRLTVDLYAEREQMVGEAYRMLANHFYDSSMHNSDWAGIVEEYKPLLSASETGEEFTILMQMMLGELDASHLGAWTYGSNEGISADTAEIGLDFEMSTEGPGLMVKYVMPRGPCDYDETRIESGEWVMAINGVPVSTSNNYWALLDNAIARSTVLTVAADQNSSETRDVTIVPISRYGAGPFAPSYSSIAYDDWVDRNRKVVDEISNGRVGYAHVRWMSGAQLERFARELFSENADKEALIMDIRWNPGGNIHEYLLDILSREQFGWSRPRDGQTIEQPAPRWGRPTVLLINERSSSDSEIFPSGFRTLGLGTIIGQTTLGAVIGTEGYTLIDGQTGIRLPIEGWYAYDGTNLENYGVPPDIFVENDLNDIRDGIDDQLKYAVNYLLEELD